MTPQRVSGTWAVSGNLAEPRQIGTGPGKGGNGLTRS